MAANKLFELGIQLTFVVGAGVKSGDPVCIGSINGVALTDADVNNQSVVDMMGVYLLPVKGVNAGGNVAVAIGDPLYFTAGQTPPISKIATGVLFGYAYAVVTSGGTTSIAVILART